MRGRSGIRRHSPSLPRPLRLPPSPSADPFLRRSALALRPCVLVRFGCPVTPFPSSTMSLYSHAFELLPRPDRSIFSSGDEATRARLPDFDTVAQLSQFTHRLIVWQMDVPSTFTQAKVGASFICILIVVVCLIMARRLYERSFWILRVIKRPAGSILVVSGRAAAAVERPSSV